MLAVDFYRIHPDQVARLKEWMAEITTRRNEALETYVQEGVRHEMGYLIEGREGPMLVWVMEVHDRDEATHAFLNSKLPIDLQHQQVTRQVVADGSSRRSYTNAWSQRSKRNDADAQPGAGVGPRRSASSSSRARRRGPLGAITLGEGGCVMSEGLEPGQPGPSGGPGRLLALREMLQPGGLYPGSRSGSSGCICSSEDSPRFLRRARDDSRGGWWGRTRLRHSPSYCRRPYTCIWVDI